MKRWGLLRSLERPRGGLRHLREQAVPALRAVEGSRRPPWDRLLRVRHRQHASPHQGAVLHSSHDMQQCPSAVAARLGCSEGCRQLACGSVSTGVSLPMHMCPCLLLQVRLATVQWIRSVLARIYKCLSAHGNTFLRAR